MADYTYSFCPQTDLWEIICPKGFVFDYCVFKREAVVLCRRLNAGEYGRPEEMACN